MRWVKGQSGNPGGRPKNSEVRLLARKHTRAAFAELLRICRSGDSSAAKVAAAKVILAYGHGSPESVRPEEMPDDVLRAEVMRRIELERVQSPVSTDPGGNGEAR